MRLIFLFLISMIVSGCTYTAVAETGNAIDPNKVALIQKDKTTENEILSMFGKPITKVVVSETDSRWVYKHIVSRASTQDYTRKTNSSVTIEILDILFRKNVVINFAFTESETNPAISVNQSF